MSVLDELLPRFDFHEVHEVVVTVSPEEALERALELPVASDPLVRILLRLRGIRVSGTLAAAFGSLRFEELGRTPTEIVVGFAGKPWRPGGGVARFRDAGPGMVRVATDFRAEPAGGGSRLSTETRIVAVDEEARRAFRRYWLVVGPFSALIRRRWLRAIQRSV